MIPIPEKQFQKNLEEIQSLKRELKKTQKRLAIEKERHKKSERTLKILINSISDAIILHDLNGNILYVNDVMLEMYGVNREVVNHLSITKDLSSPNNPIEKLHKIWKSVLAGDAKTIEWIAKRPSDGKEFIVEVVLCKINIEGKRAILATIHNISKSKKIEQKLKDQKGFLQTMIDNIPVGVFVKHPDTLEYILWNKTNEKIFGVTEAEAIGKTAFDIFSKNFANFSLSMDKEALANNKIVDIPEHIYEDKNQKHVILHTKKLPLYDKNGEPLYLLCITENITERKKIEQGIARDIEKASLVQKSILTNKDFYTKIEHLVIDVRYLPMNQKIGGDYYNIHKLEDDIISVVIADVAGHGIQAALSTMQLDLLFRESLFLPIPYQRLGLINSLLFHEMFSYNYFTCFVLNIYKDKIQYASGGHPPQFLLRKKSQTIKELKVKGRLLGADEKSIYESSVEEIEGGDILIFFTDGLYEVFNKKEEEFGTNQLYSFLLQSMNKKEGNTIFDMTPSEINNKILNKIYNYKEGTDTTDDITLITIKIR